MPLCPSACGDIELLSNPASCITDVRLKTLSRIAFFPCNMSIPDPIEGNIAPLFDDGTIVVTSELGGFTVNDPTTEDVAVSSCRPPKRVIQTREIVFQDRIKVALTSGSPATTNYYFDYDFWKDKLEHEFNLGMMWIYCDGDVMIPRDANGNILTFSLLGFINWQQPSNQGGAWVEFKQFSMIFQGDPFAFIAPDFNLEEEGIVI